MEVLAFLFILGIVLITIKLLGLVFRAGIFLISLPFQIIAAVVTTVVLFMFLPVALIAGLLSVVLIPLGILAPFLLVGFGIYLLARK